MTPRELDTIANGLLAICHHLRDWQKSNRVTRTWHTTETSDQGPAYDAESKEILGWR